MKKVLLSGGTEIQVNADVISVKTDEIPVVFAVQDIEYSNELFTLRCPKRAGLFTLHSFKLEEYIRLTLEFIFYNSEKHTDYSIDKHGDKIGMIYVLVGVNSVELVEITKDSKYNDHDYTVVAVAKDGENDWQMWDF